MEALRGLPSGSVNSPISELTSLEGAPKLPEGGVSSAELRLRELRGPGPGVSRRRGDVGGAGAGPVS